MSNRPSAFVLIARMFAFNFAGSYLISLFWNGLSGRDMFPLAVVFWVAVTLTVIFMSVGWAVVTRGSQMLLKDDQDFQEWKKKGGRPYLDSLPWPIHPDSPDDRENG